MSLRFLPNHDDHGVVTVSTQLGVPTHRREPPAQQSAATPAAPPANQSRLGTVLALVGAGLLMQGVGDALDRTGHEPPALPLFLGGIAVIFTACAWRLTGAHASRRERVWVSLVLGLGLLASYVMHHPLFLDSFDEMAHFGTLMRMLDSRSLIPTNTVLPVSPYYPGLELVTVATKWLTGLPLVLDQLIVLAAARVVLVLSIFLVVERACRSSRAGGIGVLVYAASPQFYGFDTQYAYETLALVFAVAVVHLLLVSIDAPRPRMGRSFALALSCIGAMVLTHHVTTWLTVGFLVVWAAGLYLTVHAPARPAPDHGEPPIASGERLPFRARIGLHRGQSTKRRVQARIVGLAALVGLVVGGTWTAFVGRRLTGYVGPVLDAASADISAALGNLHGNRQLFVNASGGGSPDWGIAVMLAAAICWCLILLPSLYSVIWKRSVRGGTLRYLPAIIAALYPLSLLANISSTSKEVAGRATTFIFFGVAVVVGGWLARRLSRDRRGVERMATIGVATLCFLGSVLLGGGPLPSYVPGHYRVGADELSLGSPSLAVATWANTHLPAGSHVAADRDNGAVLNALGGVDSVTAQSGLVNPAPLFFDHQLSPFDTSLIRDADIRYIVIDDRLAEGLPLYGTYVAAGEPQTRLTLAELDKFNSIPGVRRIYDNGAIQVYDLSVFLGKSPWAAPTGLIDAAGGKGLDVGVLLAAILVAVMWVIRLRRRSGPVRIDEHVVVCGVVGAMVIGLFGAFLVRLTHLPPSAIALSALLVLLALSLRPEGWRSSDLPIFRHRSTRLLGPTSSPVDAAEPRGSDSVRRPEIPMSALNTSSPEPASVTDEPRRARRSRSQIGLGCAGLALFALGASLATVTALKEWTPPPELSVMYGPAGQPVADVQLGSAGPIPAGLVVVDGGRPVWLTLLSRNTTAQRIALPASVLHPGSRVLLVASGHTLREVDG